MKKFPRLGVKTTSLLAGLITVLTLGLPLPGDRMCSVPPNFTPIFTAQEFANISLNPGSNYALCADIDLTGYSQYFPIPNFTGSIEGNNYTISNLVIKRNGIPDLGIFTRIKTASPGYIRNFTLANFTIWGGEFIGTLASRISAPATTGAKLDVSNIKVINPSVSSAGVSGRGGALVSYAQYANISDVTVTQAAVWGQNRAGGLIGFTFSADVKRATVTTSSTGSIGGYAGVGGIVGFAYDTKIEDSKFSGNLRPFVDFEWSPALAQERGAGGLVGVLANSKIIMSRAAANIKLAGTATYNLGGLAGVATSNTGDTTQNQLRFSLSEGKIEAAGNISPGGLVGWVNYDSLIDLNLSMTALQVTPINWGNVGGLYGLGWSYPLSGLTANNYYLRDAILGVNITVPTWVDSPYATFEQLGDLNSYTNWRDDSAMAAVTQVGDGVCSKWELLSDSQWQGTPEPQTVGPEELACSPTNPDPTPSIDPTFVPTTSPSYSPSPSPTLSPSISSSPSISPTTSPQPTATTSPAPNQTVYGCDGSPAIYGPAITGPEIRLDATNTIARITWSTTQPADGIINYGTSLSYGGYSQALDFTVGSHSIDFPVYPGTNYWALRSCTGTGATYGCTSICGQSISVGNSQPSAPPSPTSSPSPNISAQPTTPPLPSQSPSPQPTEGVSGQVPEATPVSLATPDKPKMKKDLRTGAVTISMSQYTGASYVLEITNPKGKVKIINTTTASYKMKKPKLLGKYRVRYMVKLSAAQSSYSPISVVKWP